MGENSKIEWCDHTFNPWIGCSKVSPACENCYADVYGNRFGVKWGPRGDRRRTSAENWRKPLVWNRRAERDGVRQKVFCASLADVFEERSDLVEWRNQLFSFIESTPWLDWLLLTKRPRYAWLYFGFGRYSLKNGCREMPQNIWIGTTVENQLQADKRIHELVKIPARVRFLSMEPLLGPVDLDLDDIGWVIVGGESGPCAREMKSEWVLSIRDQCAAASVPFFFKQWGGINRKVSGRILDGRTWDEMPIAEDHQ